MRKPIGVCLALSLLLGAGDLLAEPRAASEVGSWIPEQELLDIGILVLDPGIKKKHYLLSGYETINPELRQSEAAFVAVHLMRTLQESGSFGLVRMMPRNSLSADLFVTGRIRESSGRRLGLELEVLDATGRRWLKRVYKQKARPAAYAFSFHTNIEPFQEVYDQFVDDLIREQSRMKGDYLEVLRQIADLRFAEQLAPGVFSGYLTVDRKGKIELDRLPARDDPMMKRIRVIRTRDEFFLDLLAERYQGFYAAMDKPYDDFRATRYDVELALRDARAQANLANGRLLLSPPSEGFGSRNPLIGRVAFYRRQAAAQADYLDEISSSFAAELDPLKLELDGEVIRFEGTIEDQYRQWQGLLERIFEIETGMSARTQVFDDDLVTRH